MTPAVMWLIIGVILSLAELHFAIGLLFAGLGAIATGALIHYGQLAEDAYATQGVIFIITSALFAVLLWKPLQKYRRPAPGYNNMVGEAAFVGSSGLGKKGGEVTWSGTIMKAQIAPGVARDTLEAGSQVTIVAVKGATLIVKPND